MFGHIDPTDPPPPRELVAVLVTAGMVAFGGLLLALLPDREPRLGNLLMLLPPFAACLRLCGAQRGAFGVCLCCLCVLPSLAALAWRVTEPETRQGLIFLSAVLTGGLVYLQLPVSLDDDWERDQRERFKQAEEETIRRTWREAQQRRTPAQQNNRDAFFSLLTRILVQVVRHDDDIAVRDQAFILRFFKNELRLESERLEGIRRLMLREAAASRNLDALLAEFRLRFAPASRLLLAEAACRLARVAQSSSPVRLALARDIVAKLNLDPIQRRNLEAKFGVHAEQERAREQTREDERIRREQARRREEVRRQEESRRRHRALLTPEDEHAFAVLGLPPDAKFSAVRKAYRKLAHQYHPDTVSHLGEEYRRIATKKMQVINAAYDRLARKFGKEQAHVRPH